MLQMSIYPPNPSNSRMFEIEGENFFPLPPNTWYQVPEKIILQESIEKTMNAACVKRAKMNLLNTSLCPFPFLLSYEPEFSAYVFLTALAGMDKVNIKTLNVQGLS